MIYTRIFAIASILISGCIALIPPAAAQQKDFANAMLNEINASTLPTAGEDAANLDPIIARLINVFLSVFGIIFLSIILYAGYIWMKANGREDEIDRAKKMIQSGIIGLGLTLTAYVISYFVVTQFWQAVQPAA